MIPNRLVHHFDRLAEAPKAVRRLRRFIFDLAVRGKLVEQDLLDETAARLRERISAEKVVLGFDRSPREPNSSTEIMNDEVPFLLPESWCWVRLRDISSYIQRGKSPTYASNDGLPVVSQKCVQWEGLNLESAKLITKQSIKAYEEVRFLRDGDLLWNSTGTGTIGRIIRVTDPPSELVCDSHVTVVRCIRVNEEYVRTWLRSDHVYGRIEGRATGATNQIELTSRMANDQIVPLPPLAEQHRIVAKVGELMALCDRFEGAQSRREQTRDRLVRASLHRLGESDAAKEAGSSDGLRDSARFVLDHVPRLTTRPAHIKQLRETILDFAVRGKLVMQNPQDESGFELIKQIQTMKSRFVLGRENLRKPPIKSTGLRFEYPANWSSATLGDVCNMVTSGSRGWAEFYSVTGAKFIRAQNVRFGQLRINELASITLPRKTEGVRTQVSLGDLLIVITGAGVTNPAIVDVELGEAYVSQHIALMKPTLTSLSRWLLLYLMAPAGGRSLLLERAYGAGKPGLNLNNIRSLRVPIPPLTEQLRIIERVETLTNLCDRLESRIITATNHRSQLLDAFLDEATATSELSVMESVG